MTSRPERGVDAPELEPDVAAAHHQEPRRRGGQLERRGRVPHAGAGSSPGSVAGREPVAMIACLNLSVAGGASSRDTRIEPSVSKRPWPATTSTPRALASAGQPLGEAADGPLGPGAQPGDVDARRAEGDARVRSLGRVVDQRGDAEERLRRNAADVEALAAERAARLDEHRVEPEVGRAEGGRIAARSAAQDDDVRLAG